MTGYSQVIFDVADEYEIGMYNCIWKIDNWNLRLFYRPGEFYELRLFYRSSEFHELKIEIVVSYRRNSPTEHWDCWIVKAKFTDWKLRLWPQANCTFSVCRLLSYIFSNLKYSTKNSFQQKLCRGDVLLYFFFKSYLNFSLKNAWSYSVIFCIFYVNYFYTIQFGDNIFLQKINTS